MKNKLQKKEIYFFISIIVFIILVLLISNLTYEPIEDSIDIIESTEKGSTVAVKNINEFTNSDFSVHYIDVGQADSILITSNNHALLIDAGNNKDGKTIVNYIKNLGIKTLDYAIGTHPHSDHIGGLDTVIKKLNVKEVLMPNIQTNTMTFTEILDAIEAKNVKLTVPKVNDTFTFGDASFTVLSIENNVEEFNLASIVVRVDYKNCSYIFCADAEIPNEEKMLKNNLNVKADIIKIGHHGSYSSSSKAFLEAVNPTAAIITLGADNDYGYPHRETVRTLNELDIPFYRTDINGTIIVTSDGEKNTIYLSKEW